MRQKIVKPAPFQFKIFWDDSRYQSQVIELNFKPLIDVYSLTGNFVLLHWQNKPLGLRRFGIYDGKNDQYYGIDADKFEANFIDSKIELVQIDELKYVNIRPTATILIRDCIVIQHQDEILLESALKPNSLLPPTPPVPAPVLPVAFIPPAPPPVMSEPEPEPDKE